MRRAAGRLRLSAIAAALAAAGAAGAVDYPVGGTLSINGNAGDLPDGGVFAGSGYDPATGAIASGAFAFPDGTIEIPTPLGTAIAHYVFTQTNTSDGLVAADGVAALAEAVMQIEVTSASVGGLPIAITPCVIGPILLDLAGTASATGLDLSDDGFTIPPVASGDCGGNGDTVNAAIAGDDNAVGMTLAGDFTPPADERIFADGFDGA
jgi:hypothetical protein